MQPKPALNTEQGQPGTPWPITVAKPKWRRYDTGQAGSAGGGTDVQLAARRQPPVDRPQSAPAQILVGLRKMAAAEESAVCRQRRGMRRPEYTVAAGIDDLALLLRIAAPQQEHQSLALAVEHIHHMVGEAFPATALMGSGLALFYRQHGVEQQHPLPRPWQQAAVVRTRDAQVGLDFLVDVQQRRRHRHTRHHRETQAMGLAM